MLLLQFQRVSFDKESKFIKKITNPVKFDKIIYTDRFMLENKSASSVIRSEVREYKKKIHALEQALTNYRKFGPDQLNLPKVLSTAIHFLQHQNEGMITESEEPGLKLYSPAKIGDLGHGTEAMKLATEFLSEYEKTVKSQIEQMESLLAEYQSKVAHSYDHMRNYKYQLHSIVIHSGQADSGHYFAYIFDFEQNKWRKYNDMNITEISEEEVIKTAIGEENSTVSAYCLIYVSKENEMRVQSPNALIRQFSLTESKLAPEKMVVPTDHIIDYYTSLLPTKLRQEVVEDNIKLDNEIAEYRAGLLVKKLEQIVSEAVRF